MQRHLSRPSPALVVASLALVVALGGTSYAAITLPKNSVGTKQIKKNAVTTSKIKKNAVTTSKVKNGSLLARDFKSGQLPKGPAGPPGDPGVAFGELSYRVSDTFENLAGKQTFAEAVCDDGTFAIGGGGILSSSGVGQDINSSYPSDGSGDGTSGTAGWTVYADNQAAADPQTDPQTVTAYVVCAPADAVDNGISKAKAKAARK